MRKRILSESHTEPAQDEPSWLDLEALAEVEVSSEAPGHSIESAILPGDNGGWKAAETGEQTIRIIFDSPQRLHHIHLRFQEKQQARTQEFVLGWSPDGRAPFNEIVRQQYNFSPPETAEEIEDYQIDLKAVKVLELKIRPQLGEGCVASLARLRIA
jgi:hypothetical protein